MAELALSVEVAAPADATFAAATDWARQGEWMPLTTVRVRSGDGAGVGSELDAVTGRGRLGVHDPMRITGWTPGRRCEVAHLGRVVRGAGVFEVDELGAGRSRFTWAEWLEPPLGVAGQAGYLLLRPGLHRVGRLALARFARWVPVHAATGR